MQQFNNILIIKPGAIGDLLLLTPVVRILGQLYPGARVTVLVNSNVSAALFAENPNVNATIIYDKKGVHRSWPAFSRLWRRIRAERFDLVLNFQRSNVKMWLLVAAAFPCRLLVYHKARGRVIHAVQNHLETLAPLGIDASAADKTLEVFVGEEASLYADTLFRNLGFEGRRIVALNPGATHPVNRWRPGSFAMLADRLTNELGAKVVIVGGKDDLGLAKEIYGRTACAPVILAGKTDLLQLGAVLKRCTVLVSGDTGPMHMATAVGTRVVALFGAADPARTGPVGTGHQVIQAPGVSCVPCRSRQCASRGYLQCMEKLAVGEVFDAVAVAWREMSDE